MRRRLHAVVLVFMVACGGTIEDRPSGDATTTSDASATTSAGDAAVTVTTGPGAGGGGGATSPAAGTGGVGGIPTLVGGGAVGDPEIVRLCAGHVYACGDGIDGDDDGLVDAADPDCHGACDDDEATLWSPIVDDPDACAEDCYFDADAGPGNDGCRWDFRCDPSSVAPGFDPTGEEACAHDPTVTPGGTTCDALRTGQPPGCVEACLPLVPNGCDCFGCCARPGGGGTFWMGSHDGAWEQSCSTTTLDDPTVCRPCQQVPSCLNPCAPCEVCLGGPAPPAGCDPAAQCPAGLQACGLPGQPLCPDLTYCVSGCCRDVVR